MGATINFTARKSGIYQLTITPWSAQDVVDLSGNISPYGGGPYPPSPIVVLNVKPDPTGNQGKSWDRYGSVGKYALVGTWTGPTYLSPTSDMTVSSSNITFNNAVTFVGTAADPNIGNSGLFTYVWDFGDPLSLTNSATQTNVATSNVSHTYKAPGVYTARLIVTDSFGKSSVAATKVINVTGSLPPAIKIDAPLVASWRIATNVERSANVSLRVVDQYGQSIVGALVSVSVVNGTATTKIGAKTDGQGNFTYAMPKQLNSKPGDFTFTITGVTPVKAGATYSPTAGKTGVTLRSNGTTVQF
jgi:PKD repeat protein